MTYVEIKKKKKMLLYSNFLTIPVKKKNGFSGFFFIGPGLAINLIFKLFRYLAQCHGALRLDYTRNWTTISLLYSCKGYGRYIIANTIIYYWSVVSSNKMNKKRSIQRISISQVSTEIQSFELRVYKKNINSRLKFFS